MALTRLPQNREAQGRTVSIDNHAEHRDRLGKPIGPRALVATKNPKINANDQDAAYQTKQSQWIRVVVIPVACTRCFSRGFSHALGSFLALPYGACLNLFHDLASLCSACSGLSTRSPRPSSPRNDPSIALSGESFFPVACRFGPPWARPPARPGRSPWSTTERKTAPHGAGQPSTGLSAGIT